MIDSDFERAVNLIQELPRGSAIEIKYEEKLIMYSLFQQATEGNVIGSRPSVFNNLERVKWDAWAKQKDLSTSEAKFMYCQTLKGILNRYKDDKIGNELLRKLSEDDDDDISSSRSSSAKEIANEQNNILIGNILTISKDIQALNTKLDLVVDKLTTIDGILKIIAKRKRWNRYIIILVFFFIYLLRYRKFK